MVTSVTACGGAPESALTGKADSGSNADLGGGLLDPGNGSIDGGIGGGTGGGIGGGIGGGTSEAIKYCPSFLDFTNLTWGKAIGLRERGAFSIALSISGRYEGHNGWSNLTGNFDGQGISMGLLNQPLGPGSLQPMWIEMSQVNPALMKKIMTSSHYDSMIAMLNKWQSSASAASTFNIEDYGYNELDDPGIIAEELQIDPLELEVARISLTSRNQASVNWAKANALSGTKLKTDWAAQLASLSLTAEYRSIQVEKAEKIHAKALEWMKTYGATELRSYLFLFDIAVQNGSIPASVKTKYTTWLKSNKGASEKTRMLKLLDYRAAIARPEYIADVKARKTAILNGTGTVHGMKFDYEKQFCTSLSQKL